MNDRAKLSASVDLDDQWRDTVKRIDRLRWIVQDDSEVDAEEYRTWCMQASAAAGRLADLLSAVRASVKSVRPNGTDEEATEAVPARVAQGDPAVPGRGADCAG